ncbi:hypothetical protein KI387_043200, partial [Taxus chinensis]
YGVVVVGGGIAGATTVKALENHADVTLIDPKDYFEIVWARLRCMVEPSFAERTVFLHREYLDKAKLITSAVKSITEEAVVTESGDRVKYDYLVVASGTVHNGPRTADGIRRQFQAGFQERSGYWGRTTGVELAAEIAVDFPEKKVILLHGGSRLLEFVGEKASRKTLAWMKSHKVEVHLNERIDLESLTETTTSFTTSSGKTIHADCHFLCIGQSKLGSSWMKDSIFGGAVDGQGQIKVDSSMRVEGTTNVFAAGDIVNVKELKQGFCAKKHAAVIAENIKKLSINPEQSKLSTYKASPDLAIMSLGRYAAVGQFPFGTLCGRLPGLLKSKDLFVASTRKHLGLKP